MAAGLPGPPAAGWTTLLLEPHGPYEPAAMLAALAAHAIPGVEDADLGAATYTRFLRTGLGGQRVTLVFRPEAVELTIHSADRQTLHDVEALCRRWLDFDTDLDTVNAHLRSDPVLAPLIAARPGLRILAHPDGFEAAAMTVLGQQVSLAACRTFGGRLVAALGEALEGDLKSFPSPEKVAASDPATLRAAIGLTGARARTLHALAEAFADGLSLDPGQDHTEVRRRLLAVPGIGPWTVEYLSLRALADRDAYPAGDRVLQRALGVDTAIAALAAAESWRPYRAYAVFHLWNHAAYIR